MVKRVRGAFEAQEEFEEVLAYIDALAAENQRMREALEMTPTAVLDVLNASGTAKRQLRYWDVVEVLDVLRRRTTPPEEHE